MRILWIDDEPSLWRLIARELRGKVDVVFAHGWEQIQHYMGERDVGGQEIDLILLDHDMPLMNGQEVVSNFLVERGIPVVIVSSNAPAAEKMRLMLIEAAVPVVYRPIMDAPALGKEILSRYQHWAAMKAIRSQS